MIQWMYDENKYRKNYLQSNKRKKRKEKLFMQAREAPRKMEHSYSYAYLLTGHKKILM